MDMHKMLAEFKKRAAELTRAACTEDLEPLDTSHPKVAAFPTAEAVQPMALAGHEGHALGDQAAEGPRHPAAVDAWREVLAAFELCVQSALRDAGRQADTVRQNIQETSRLMAEIDRLPLPVAIKQRLLALIMLLYPRLSNVDRNQLILALQRIPHPTRSQLESETELNWHEHNHIQGLVSAIERSTNLGDQLYALLRSISRRLGVFPLPMRPALQHA